MANLRAIRAHFGLDLKINNYATKIIFFCDLANYYYFCRKTKLGNLKNEEFRK